MHDPASTTQSSYEAEDHRGGLYPPSPFAGCIKKHAQSPNELCIVSTHHMTQMLTGIPIPNHRIATNPESAVSFGTPATE